MARLVLQQPGETCANMDVSGHRLLAPSDDQELQQVFQEITSRPVAEKYTEAIRSAIDYVLDGQRTGRFDLLSPKVHPGERASVGAKLEYEVLRSFDWPKAKPLDTSISGAAVDIKATVGDNWAVPSEAHCQLCLCTKIQLKKNRHRTWLMRTHRSWLYRGSGNKDGKRGIAVEALEKWSMPLYDWSPLPVNPLTYLTEEQASEILADKPGQEQRMLILFGYLKGVIIPRSVLETVGAGKRDPVRRARAIKERAAQRGLLLLCGTWQEDRDLAAARNISLPRDDWIALPIDKTTNLES
ncbi:NaeI family type II restriction endonuclease [Streptomyces sp. H27-D2]|uniref:NaeI family type II restriction endonuclease n=1 Tax=Streptomyces sp. H27-D2 TaxID=3046304 RepID=UPI002DBE212B|nr:NaeI family type II restriction endonuclease [Streptomyces sp. H27-D2]MEC4018121.1 NaeI family type II restriction endonuclease [Streptomyces sp. H27-D2]